MTTQLKNQAEAKKGAHMFSKGKLGAVLVVVAMAFTCVACSASKPAAESAAKPDYSLTKDASIATDWGTAAQYKVDENWTEPFTSLDSDVQKFVSYTDDKGNEFLSIEIYDADAEYGARTYNEWLRDKEFSYSDRGTAEEQADEYKLLHADFADYDPEQAEPGYYTGYENYHMEKLGTKEVGGLEYRLYELSFTETLSDLEYKFAKERDPDVQQTSDKRFFYGVVKGRGHDMEVSATSRQLLEDILDTLEVTW